MGRKNKRIISAPDKNFIKFMDSINKRNRNQEKSKPTNKQYSSGIEIRNHKRFLYALEQFQRERIQYDIIDEDKGIVKVYHQSTGDEFIYYAFTGKLKGIDNLRGLMNILEFLYT